MDGDAWRVPGLTLPPPRLVLEAGWYIKRQRTTDGLHAGMHVDDSYRQSLGHRHQHRHQHTSINNLPL